MFILEHYKIRIFKWYVEIPQQQHKSNIDFIEIKHSLIKLKGK